MTNDMHTPASGSVVARQLLRLMDRLPRPVRYLLVGGTAYVLEMAALLLMSRGFGWRPVAAVAVSFWVGFVVAFVLQKVVAFQNYERGHRALTRQLVGYAALVAFNYGFTLLVVHGLQRHFNVEIIRTAVIAVTTVWNYLLYKRLFKLS